MWKRYRASLSSVVVAYLAVVYPEYILDISIDLRFGTCKVSLSLGVI